MDSTRKWNIIKGIISGIVTAGALICGWIYLPKAYFEGIVLLGSAISGFYYVRKMSEHRRTLHEKPASGPSSYREDSDNELIERFFHLRDLSEVAQQSVKNDLASRGGLKREISFRQDSTRRQKFPSFVAGVLIFTLLPLVFGLMNGGSLLSDLKLFAIILAFAILFLSTFDSTIRPKYWRRSIFIVCILVLVRIVVLGSADIDSKSLLILLLLLSANAFCLWGVGWLGTEIFSRAFKNENYFVKLLSKVWTDLSDRTFTQKENASRT